MLSIRLGMIGREGSAGCLRLIEREKGSEHNAARARRFDSSASKLTPDLHHVLPLYYILDWEQILCHAQMLEASAAEGLWYLLKSCSLANVLSTGSTPHQVGVAGWPINA